MGVSNRGFRLLLELTIACKCGGLDAMVQEALSTSVVLNAIIVCYEVHVVDERENNVFG